MYNNVMNTDGSFKPFRAWCQHVLPQIYDDSLSYMELLNKVITYINDFGEYLEEFSAINKVKYGGPWDVTKQYTPNTVVSVGDTGYMSIKPVPAGIDITNTDYWLKVADFAGQVIDLGLRVIALENQMTQVESNISTIQGDISTINGDIESIHGDITDINGDIDSINGNITSINSDITDIHSTDNTQDTNISTINSVLADNQIKPARYAIWIGDSYTMAGSLGADVDKRFSTLVSGYLGLTEKNYGVGSCGFIKGNTPYTTQLTNAINDFETNELDKNLVKYVFISSCRNDTNYGTRGEIGTAVRTLVTTINSEFPNAKIVITPLLWDWKTIYYNSRLLDYICEIQRASYYGNNVIIVDYGYEWLMGTPDVVLYENGGDVHPTVFGHKIIANHLYSAINGNNWRRYEFASFTPTTANNITDFAGFYELEDGYINLNFKFKATADISSGVLFQLAINNAYFSNFFITDRQDEQLFFNLESRDLGGYVTNTAVKAILKCNATRSSQTDCSYLMNVQLYGNGTLITNHYYYARLRIPYGRINYPRMT